MHHKRERKSQLKTRHADDMDLIIGLHWLIVTQRIVLSLNQPHGLTRTTSPWPIRDDLELSAGVQTSGADNVTPGFVIDRVANFGERFNSIGAGTNRQTTHTLTSTTASVIGAGIGSPCFFKLST